jgi:hypothetical protein
MEVIQVSARPAPHGVYAVAGRLLFIESYNLQLRNLIVELFAGWQLTPVTAPERAPDIRIEFFCCDALPEIPPKLNHFEIAESGKCYTNGADYYLTLSNALLHLQNGNEIAVSVWFAELPGPRDPVLARMTSFAVCAALRRFGLFELHSAGVVHPESEKGVLIIGPSGSGKSTLALQLALAGWPYLSDDELLLSLVNGEVEARGFRSFFAVSSATAVATGIDKIGGSDSSGRFKTCFEPNTVVAAQRKLQALPRLLLFISLSGEYETRLNKLTQAESMTRLIRACPWATYDTAVAARNLELLSTLARQTSAFDLFAGRDLLEPKHASDLLSRYLEVN